MRYNIQHNVLVYCLLFRSVTTKFGIGKATAWRSVKRVVKAVCALRNYFIQWPSATEARETSMRIMQKRYPFPGVIGAVDGTHIHIAAPKIESQAYINRKGVHSIQLQVSILIIKVNVNNFNS